MKKNAHLEVFIAPAVVLLFAGILSLMYGWVGTMQSLGQETQEMPEPPKTRIVAGVAPGAPPPPKPEGLALNTGIGSTQMRLLDVNATRIPSGIGNTHIQLLNATNIPAGIGNAPMRFLDGLDTNGAPGIPSGVGGPQGQIQLINNNGGMRPYLGLEVSAINAAMASKMGLPRGTGLYIKDVMTHSPAQKAGFSKGDILIKCDLKSVSSLDQLNKVISLRKPGDVIKCIVLTHKGRKKSFHVKLSDGPTGFRPAAATKPGQNLWVGMEVQNIDAVMRRQMRLPKTGGVIVSFLNSHSPAADSGVRIGDMVRKVNGVHITEAEQFRSTVAQNLNGQPIELALLRRGKNATVNIRPAPRPAVRQTIPKVPQAEMAIEGSWIGMDVSELKPGETAEFGLPGGVRGIVVNDVESPPATTVGFQTGDCITAVNSTPTPTMKTFVRATKGQRGAVVDIIRGNRHMYITVPPPGFTQQGTPLKQHQVNPLQQVAAQAAAPAPLIIAILSDQNSLSANVGAERSATGLILFDPQNNRYTAASVTPGMEMKDILAQNRARALIVGAIGNKTKSELQRHGVKIYSGVFGRVIDAFQLYQAGRLVAAK